MRIVIVEDEPKIRSGMRKLIDTHTKHRVIGEAGNGKEGLETVERLRPDLVISDIRMPEMDGLEMMEEFQRRQLSCRTVILSGYSEFDYARKAMRFGAVDYLLKPLAAEDVMEVLEKIQGEITREQEEQALTAEGRLRTVLISGRNASAGDIRLLAEAAGFADAPCMLIAGYLGGVKASYRSEAEGQLSGLSAFDGSCRLCMAAVEEWNQYFCLIQTTKSHQELLQYLQRKLYLFLESREQPVWAAAEAEHPETLGAAVETVRRLQFFGSRIGFRTIVTERAVQELERSGEAPVYPKALEPAIQNALLRRDEKAFSRAIEELMAEMKRASRDLQQYREIFLKLLRFMENVLQETDSAGYREMEAQRSLQNLQTAVRLDEMELCLQSAAKASFHAGDSRENISNYTILRAISFIKEHYSENISLEMIADRLDITPEYLSTLFNREMGINFSTFLKKFRISHAKRLLRGSDMKIYEVAAAVGYRDPKYFNRVFKEEEGMSPGDFR